MCLQIQSRKLYHTTKHPPLPPPSNFERSHYYPNFITEKTEAKRRLMIFPGDTEKIFEEVLGKMFHI